MSKLNFIQKILFICFLNMLLIPSPSEALKEDTHALLNLYIASNNIGGFNLNSFIEGELSFNLGTGETFSFENKSLTVYQWLEHGGKREDDPWNEWWRQEDLLPGAGRFYNHFHEPISNSGLWGWNQSAIQWAFMPPGGQGATGNYSWNDVRSYFYDALTAENDADRQENFAKTFRGLGQLMHLVQDMSVPEHVRNDGHLLWAYEGWMENSQNFRERNGSLRLKDCYNPHENIPIEPKFFDSVSLVPVAYLFDTNQYNGGNPDITLNNDIGLSEYTSANFLSPDTMFAFQSGDLPYPRVIFDEEDTTSSILRLKKEIDPLDGETEKYYSKVRHGETIDYFLRSSLTNNYMDPECTYQGDCREYWMHLINDDRVFANYAKLLIPRAVGYSAQLLQYFFRGKLQVPFSLPITEFNAVTSFDLKLKNMSQNQEEIKNGYFTIVVRYTPAGGNPDGSEDVFIRSYLVPVEALPYDQEANFLFPLHQSISMEDLNNAECMLVFRGTLGNEVNAVIGKAFTPGKIKFHEDWANGLSPAGQPWFHTEQGSDQNPDNGETKNTIENSMLKKDNIRNIGDDRPRINQSFIYLKDFNEPYQVENMETPDGMRITPNTYLRFKIDDLSINEKPPAPPGYTCDYQMMALYFNSFLLLQISQEGQAADFSNLNELTLGFQLGKIVRINIYDAFQSRGYTIPEPFYLQSIDLHQHLWFLDDPSTIEHHQHMEVDFITIIEASVEQ